MRMGRSSQLIGMIALFGSEITFCTSNCADQQEYLYCWLLSNYIYAYIYIHIHILSPHLHKYQENVHPIRFHQLYTWFCNLAKNVIPFVYIISFKLTNLLFKVHVKKMLNIHANDQRPIHSVCRINMLNGSPWYIPHASMYCSYKRVSHISHITPWQYQVRIIVELVIRKKWYKHP